VSRPPQSVPVLLREHKARRPRASGLFTRERLLAALDAAGDRRLSWIQGPSGAGKTALLATWLDERGLDAVWCRLDAADREPSTLFAQLALAFEVRWPERPLPRFTAEHHPTPELFARHFFRSAFAARTAPIVVLDDAQCLGDAGAGWEVLRWALDELPPGGRVLVASQQPPPGAFARLRAAGDLAVVPPSALNVQALEARELAAWAGRSLDLDGAEALVAATGGWFPAVSASLRSGDAPAGLTSEAARSYLEHELLGRLPPADRGLLYAVAFVEPLDGDAAVAASGLADAAQRLASLVERGLFVDRYDDGTLRLHPLLREALRAGAEQALGRDRFVASLQVAIDRAMEADDAEHAVAIALRAGEPDRVARIVVEAAPAALREGRHDAVLRWAGALPPEVAAGSPWVALWVGAAHLSRDMKAAREHLDRALDAFEAAGDPVGIALAWSLLVQSVLIEREATHRLAPLVQRFARLLGDGDGLPPAVHLRVLSSMMIARALSRADHQLDLWEPRLLAAVDRVPDVEERANALATAAFAWTLVGVPARAAWASERVDRLAAGGGVTAGTELLIHIGRVFGAVQRDPAAVEERVGAALALAHERGAIVWNVSFHQHAASAALLCGELERARAHLDAYAPQLERLSRLDRSYHLRMTSWLAACEGRPAEALARAREDVAVDAPLGSKHNTRGARASLALRLLDVGDVAGAAEVCPDPAVMRDQFAGLLALTRALVAIRRGESPREALTSGLSHMRTHGVHYLAGMTAAQRQELFANALRLGVEPEFVQHALRVQRLTVPAPRDAPAGWPWPLKVHTLGRWLIEREGQPATSDAKKPTQRALVGHLIARRGRPAAPEHIAEALWPESDGDRAIQAFRTALHRLRRSRVWRDVVCATATGVALDPAGCWVDAWRVCELGSRADTLSAPEREEARALLDGADGPFVADTDPVCVAFGREVADALKRLRSRLS